MYVDVNLHMLLYNTIRGITRGVMAKILDCIREISEFELQSCGYVLLVTNTLRKNMKPHILSYRLNNILLFFCMNHLGIKLPMRVNKPLKK